MTPDHVDVRYDGGPTGCGELIMNIFQLMQKMTTGQVLEVISYDLGAREDIPAWCRLQGHTLLQRQDIDEISHYFIQKGESTHEPKISR